MRIVRASAPGNTAVREPSRNRRALRVSPVGAPLAAYLGEGRSTGSGLLRKRWVRGWIQVRRKRRPYKLREDGGTRC
jgi:hypothetical protein